MSHFQESFPHLVSCKSLPFASEICCAPMELKNQKVSECSESHLCRAEFFVVHLGIALRRNKGKNTALLGYRVLENFLRSFRVLCLGRPLNVY